MKLTGYCHLMSAFRSATGCVPDSTSAWRNASARYSQTLEAHGQAASTAGLYGTLLEDNNLGYSIQSGYTREGMRGAVKQDMPL